MMKSFCFLLLIVSQSLFAQAYEYQLKGSYKLESSQKGPVNYTLQWNEDKGQIKGVYRDDFFDQTGDVTGREAKGGRNFTVSLPQIKKGVRSINLLLSSVKESKTGTTIPVSVITRDKNGTPLSTTDAPSNFIATKLLAQKQEDTDCIEGFGNLAQYCGTYAGMITEDQDRRNKCNLLFIDAVRLELRPDATLVLHLGEAGTIVQEPVHEIGRLPANPQTNSIDVLSRSCRPLPGVNARGDSCKELNLRGEFSDRGPDRHFRGTYTIKEEGTNNVCIYGLSMDQQNLQ